MERFTKKIFLNEGPVNPPYKPLSGKNEIKEQPINPPKPNPSPSTSPETDSPGPDWKEIAFDVYNRLKNTGKEVKKYANKLWGKISDITNSENAQGSQSDSNLESTADTRFNKIDVVSKDILDGKVIKYGMKGPIVTEIQKRLLVHNPDAIISRKGKETDDLYGWRTRKAVREFQKIHKDKNGNQLKADGQVGPLTWTELLKNPQGQTKSIENNIVTTTTTTVKPEPPKPKQPETPYTPTPPNTTKTGGGPSRETTNINDIE